jgi:hypothetical protein
VALTVTAVQSGDTLAGMGLTVKVLTGQAASPIGTVASSGTITTPQLAIVPSVAGSWVYGAIYDAGGSTTFTVDANTTFSLNVHDATHAVEYGTFRSTAVTTTSSTVYGATAPTNSASLIGLAMVEIKKGVGSLVEDASSPTPSSTTTATTITSGSFTPPAGALLVAQVSADTAGSGTLAMTTNVTDTSGLTWTRQSFGNQVVGGFTYACASVWTALVPAGVTSRTVPVISPSAAAMRAATW